MDEQTEFERDIAQLFIAGLSVIGMVPHVCKENHIHFVYDGMVYTIELTKAIAPLRVVK